MKTSLVSKDLRKRFTAAWMSKGMAMLYKAKRVGFTDAECLDINHLDFWIGMQEIENESHSKKEMTHG